LFVSINVGARVMAGLLEQVWAFSERHTLLRPHMRIVVAVSGGPDSLCLLHLLHQLAPRLNLRLQVAHLDHQLRPESVDDARFVAQLAAAWGMPATIRQEDVAALARSSRTSMEAAGRIARYRFLATTAHETGAHAIAVGHTADDQAETVLLRLLRGAGPHGLAAMRPKRLEAGIPIIRPLLETTRSEVEAYCAEQGLAPRYDRSNEAPDFLRNRVRGYILPLLKTYNPSIVAALGRTARLCAEEDDLLNDLVEQHWPMLAAVNEAGVLLDRHGFRLLHPALQRRIVRKSVQMLDPDVELQAKHLDLALAAIEAQRRRMQLPHRIWLHINQSHLRFEKDRGEQSATE
jgi:tRNA(Ile)-lysidine synthase